MTKIVENDNTDPAYEYIIEMEWGVREMSEHSLPNMLHLLDVRVKIGVKSIHIMIYMDQYNEIIG